MTSIIVIIQHHLHDQHHYRHYPTSLAWPASSSSSSNITCMTSITIITCMAAHVCFFRKMKRQLQIQVLHEYKAQIDVVYQTTFCATAKTKTNIGSCPAVSEVPLPVLLKSFPRKHKHFREIINTKFSFFVSMNQMLLSNPQVLRQHVLFCANIVFHFSIKDTCSLSTITSPITTKAWSQKLISIITDFLVHDSLW